MKKGLKKLLKFFCVFILIILTIFLIDILLSHDRRILKGYYKEDDYSEQHPYRGYVDYYKYYYTENNDTDFQNSKLYTKVGSENIEKLKLYFEDFKGWMEASKRLSDYDFDTSIIDENDYFVLSSDTPNDNMEPEKLYQYNIAFYDINSHILYIISFKN